MTAERGGNNHGCLSTALTIGFLAASFYFDVDNSRNYQAPPRKQPNPTEFLGDIENEANLAQATARYYLFAESEQQKADQMDILFKVTPMTNSEVQTMFGQDIQPGEQWFAGWEAALYEKDGGPEEVGIPMPIFDPDDVLILNERGLHALGDIQGVKNILRKYQHPADVEMNIAIYKIVNGKINYEGFILWRHGEPVFVSADEFEYTEDEKGNLHAIIHVAIKKDTEYESEYACNTAKVQGTINLGPFQIDAAKVGIRSDSCKGEYMIETRIDLRNNVSEPNNRLDPLKTNPDLVAKYGIHERTWRQNEKGEWVGNWFYGGVYNHEDYSKYTPDQIKEAQANAKHSARLDFFLPQRRYK